jgi:hypothetical protein
VGFIQDKSALLLCPSMLLLYPVHMQSVKNRTVHKGKQKRGHSSNTVIRKNGDGNESDEESEDDIAYEAKSVKNVDDLFTESRGISWRYNFTDLWSSQSLPTSMTILTSDKTIISFEDGKIRVLLMHTSGAGELLDESPSVLFDFQSSSDRRQSVLLTHICPWEQHTEHSSSFEILCCRSKNILSHWRLEIKNKIKIIPNRYPEECSSKSNNKNHPPVILSPISQSNLRIISQREVQRHFSSFKSEETGETENSENVGERDFEMLALNLGVSVYC